MEAAAVKAVPSRSEHTAVLGPPVNNVALGSAVCYNLLRFVAEA